MKKSNTLKVLELFSGIGACSKALTNLGTPHEIMDAVEIDKFAVKSFNAIHGTDFEPQDIQKWEKYSYCHKCHRLIEGTANDVDFTKEGWEIHHGCGGTVSPASYHVDLIMHGSPCQDFSMAGRQAGGDEGSGTRSSLMYETIRIVEKLKPKYVIWENVKNLLSQKHRPNFEAYQARMKALGYKNFVQVLNAKDYGIPQNRERVFTVSIREDLGQNYEFPQPIPLEKRLGDMLEEEVDEKYVLSQQMVEGMKKTNYASYKFDKFYKEKDDIADILKARFDGCPQCVQVGTLDMKGHDSMKRVYSADGISPTITTMGSGNTEPKIMEKLPGAYGREFGSKGKVENLDGIASTLQAAMGAGGGNIPLVVPAYRVRKLTPKECWRLMGFSDDDFDKASKVNSNSQLYKQAGNSIVVPILELILANLL